MHLSVVIVMDVFIMLYSVRFKLSLDIYSVFAQVQDEIRDHYEKRQNVN